MRWQPILFAGLLDAIGKVPWSWKEGPARDEEMRGCVQRAATLGLPLIWPRAWPKGTYSLLAPRAALVADEYGLLADFSKALFHQGLGRGNDLTDPAVVRIAAALVGLDADEILNGAQRPDIKALLRAQTDAAVRMGVTGVPTIAIDGHLFWGDDRIADAVTHLHTPASRAADVRAGRPGGPDHRGGDRAARRAAPRRPRADRYLLINAEETPGLSEALREWLDRHSKDDPHRAPMSALAHRLAGEQPPTPGQVRMLSILESSPASRATLAERAGVGESSVEKILNVLDARGWIDRTTDALPTVTESGRLARNLAAERATPPTSPSDQPKP